MAITQRHREAAENKIITRGARRGRECNNRWNSKTNEKAQSILSRRQRSAKNVAQLIM
jgi:hypothetical protein